MKHILFSAKLRKAFETDANNIDIVEILHRKDQSTKSDVMRLTGIRKKDYDSIFDESDRLGYFGPEGEVGVCRTINTDYPASIRIANHLCREDLTPTQRAISDMLRQIMLRNIIDVFNMQFDHLTGRYLPDELWDVDWASDDTFEEISDEEMLKVALAVQEQIAETNENKNSI